MIVMMERGRLTRISLGARSTVRTDRGFAVGDQGSVVTNAYGASAVITPHKYQAAPAVYVTIGMPAAPDTASRGILYDIGTDGRVAHVRAGGPSIQYVEGCL